MHSFLSRVNAVSAYSLSVLAFLTFSCFLSTVFVDYRKEVKIDTGIVIVKKLPNYQNGRSVDDLGQISVSLQADLTSLFNWNVRQLFIYLTAEYETGSNKRNEIVLWDTIIKRGENANLKFKDMNMKYYFWHDGTGLLGNKNVTLSLKYNLIPNAGTLPHVTALGHHTFSFPSEYTTSRS